MEVEVEVREEAAWGCGKRVCERGSVGGEMGVVL